MFFRDVEKTELGGTAHVEEKRGCAGGGRDQECRKDHLTS